jgi:hypothetical protein
VREVKLEKCKAILDLLSRLELESRGWVVVGDCEADLCAVEIARPEDLASCVYISAFKQPKGRYYYECETPSADLPLGYAVACRGESADYDELLEATCKHLDG